MQPVDVADVFWGISRWGNCYGGMPVYKVLNDSARLCQGQIAIANHRRFAKRVHLAQRGRRPHGRFIALIGLTQYRDAAPGFR
jgi:hypothetical protein